MASKYQVKLGWYFCRIEHLSEYGGHYYAEWYHPFRTIRFWWTHVVRYNWRRFKRLKWKFHLRHRRS